ncbi:MAG: efflux RND transporter periplasmic adaptor subunit [Burkholderiales bacterium]|nr:efflux RND transporter periplasmic adaptor subunit [Burkholderiales bacterium]
MPGPRCASPPSCCGDPPRPSRTRERIAAPAPGSRQRAGRPVRQRAGRPVRQRAGRPVRQRGDPGAKEPEVKTRLVRAFVLVVLAACLGGAAWWWYRDKGEADPKLLVLHGNVDIRQVELAFNASGRIAEILVHEGEGVTKGQLLAKLDPGRLPGLIGQARAQVAAQRQVLARLKAGSRPEEIRKAAADVEAARVEARNAALAFERQQDLAARRFVAQQQADNARAAAEAAAARLKSAEEARRLVELGPRSEDIAAAEATLRAAEAALAVALRDLAETSLAAPSAGIVQNRVLQPGDMASPQRTVLTIALSEPLWVRAFLSEPDLGRVRTGSLARVRTDSHPDKHYRGWVGFVSPSAEFTPRSVETRELRSSLVYQVRVFVCAPLDELRLGMPATVELALDQPPVAPGADPCAGGP